MKPRLCRSFWRAFASTYLLMLSFTSPRVDIFAYPFSPPRSLPFLTVKSPFLLHAPAPILLSLEKVRLLLTLTLSHLTMWCSEQTALFLLAKGVLAYLPTVLFMALRPLFPFLQVQYDQAFELKPAAFCKLFAGLCCTNKPTTSLLLLSDSRSVRVILSSLLPFLLS